uniref:Ig-like domain-containing protein n=1 Tax=Naja naja TaxID=35670 RepID=A0A8C7E409_NAJNA
MNSCIQLTDAANTVIPITLSPPKPTKGQNIFLIPGLDYENFTSCGWYRGVALTSENLRLIISSQSEFYIKGDAYTGREKLCANCSLHIKHCETEDMGMYTIIMKGSMIAWFTFSLYLEVTITDPKEGTEGQSISLHCTAEGDDVVYSWTKDDQPVIEDERVYLTENDQTLNFNPCDRRDAANYKCHASNSFSSADSDPFGLIIICKSDLLIFSRAVQPTCLIFSLPISQGLPQRRGSQPRMETRQGERQPRRNFLTVGTIYQWNDLPPEVTINLTEETISLTCLAVSNPASEIEWYFNGQLIPISPEVLTRKIIPENSGDYACQATNPTSKMTSKTTMEIDMIVNIKVSALIIPLSFLGSP